MADVQQNNAPQPVTPGPTSTSKPYVPKLQQPLAIPSSSARPFSQLGPLSPVNQNGSFAFDRVIKRGRVERREKKKGAWKASWKTTHLVLRPNLLSVYKDADETELRASITLTDVTAVTPVKKSHHDHVFGVFSPSKNYHFAAATARETSDWITILRLEARTGGGDDDDLQPPNAGFQQGDDTTDLSADDEPIPTGSPEVPHWQVKGQKNRILPQASADTRKASGFGYPSGNESFATSQSDFSDGLSSSVPGPKGYLSSSVPVQPSMLTPIPDDTSTADRPKSVRGTSYLFDAAATPTARPLSKSATKPTPASASTSTSTDPSRIIKQGNLRLSKTLSGVKQWKSIWLVLRATTLSFYKSNTEYAPLTIIPIHSIVEAAEIDRKNKQNCFQLISEEKTYRLQAETENELESWLGAFKSVLVKQEQERTNRSRGPSLSLPPGEQRPVQQPPGSREGVVLGGITTQMRAANLNDGLAVKRVVSPPVAGAHGQVTSPAV